MESMMKDVRVETQIKYLQAGRKKLRRSTDCCFKFCMDRSSFWSSPSLLPSMYVQGVFLPAMGDSSSGSCSVSSFCRDTFSPNMNICHLTLLIVLTKFALPYRCTRNQITPLFVTLAYFISLQNVPLHDIILCIFLIGCVVSFRL